MHLLESISLSTGLRAGRPLANESFFPIVSEKYITIATENHQSKQWDHFQEFINLMSPILAGEGISIIEIGSNDIQLQGVISLKGATSPSHWSYVIKGAMLHVGPENVLSHFASMHETPQVALFSNTSIDYAAPTWSKNPSSQSFICSGPKTGKPSFAGEENPKTINSISAERVCSAALKLLNLKDPFKDFKVVSIGPGYHMALIEVVPDFKPPPDFCPHSLLNIRMDYHFNEDPLVDFANNRRITLITDKNINKKLIATLKPAIERMFFKVDEDSDLEYANAVRGLGVPLSLIGKKECDPNPTRLRFFDWKVSEEISRSKKDLDNSEEICDTTRYKSSKHLFSKGKKYSSKTAYLNGIESHDDQFVIDDESFWEESDHFKFYNLDRNNEK